MNNDALEQMNVEIRQKESEMKGTIQELKEKLAIAENQINHMKLAQQKQKEEKEFLQKKLEELLQERLCPKNHVLKPMTFDISSWLCYLKCDKCSNSIKKNSNYFWRCNTCDYDLCLKCCGFSKNFCIFGHQLKNRPKADKTVCGVCKREIKGNFYACGCKYSLCLDCFHS